MDLQRVIDQLYKDYCSTMPLTYILYRHVSCKLYSYCRSVTIINDAIFAKKTVDFNVTSTETTQHESLQQKSSAHKITRRITKSGLNSKSDERPNYSVAALYCRKTRLVDLYKDYIVSNRQ